ncbi:TPA_asm: nucleocapsid protein [Streptoglossa virus 1]|uniref:Nucleoprotein n=1 Tax=Streptoglossa virus 1 TaxID=2977992 RepID=A0A9N6YJK5_9RHAB|nr:TPA_asm: nucleocapsid protein [Streptoglossa virus 1]
MASTSATMTPEELNEATKRTMELLINKSRQRNMESGKNQIGTSSSAQASQPIVPPPFYASVRPNIPLTTGDSSGADVLGSRKLKVREDIAQIGYIHEQGMSNMDWYDDKLLEFRSLRLEKFDQFKLQSTSISVLGDLMSGISERTVGNILLLSWNLKSTADGQDVFPSECKGISPDFEPVSSLSKVVSYKGTSIFETPDNINDAELIKCACYISASLLRLFTKSVRSYEKAIESHIKESYHKFYRTGFPLPTFIPDKKCLEGIAVMFSSHEKFRNTLGKILYHFGDLTHDKGLCIMLFEQHVGMTGMHAVSLFLRSCAALPATVEELVSALWHRSTKRGLQALIELILRFMKSSEIKTTQSRQTWRYARLFGNEYFLSLQTRQNVPLVCILAHLCRYLGVAGNQNILDIARIQALPDETKIIYQTWAHRIHICFTRSIEASEGNELTAN